MGNSAEEMKLLDTEALKIEAREDSVTGSIGVVLFNLWTKSTGDVEALQMYGKYVITQFTPIQAVIQPLVPAIRVFKSFPFNGFLVFLTLYFVVVRNQNFSRYVRFNTMQAIVLDVLLIFPDVLERSFNPRGGLGLDLLMSLDSTVFLFLFVCLIYGSSSCLLGKLPRLPIVADAADRQVL
nr:protein tic 20-v, chloroplastic [Quercus suber]